MQRALGYSVETFDPTDPGRLCRGQERWIEPLPPLQTPSPGALPTPGPKLQRWVVTGAEFTDETARDAKRGVRFAGTTAGEILTALFPERTFLAYCEEGHPQKVPADVLVAEHYTVTRPSGRLREWNVRWMRWCDDAAALDQVIDAGADVVLAFAKRPKALPPELPEWLHFLTGQRQPGPPDRLFQSSALVDLCGLAEAVALLHLDKHGYSLGIYTTNPLEAGPVLATTAHARGALAVPFAIPPMLARWDRALWELRQDWDESKQGAFPVPPAPEGEHAWGRPRRGEPPTDHPSHDGPSLDGDERGDGGGPGPEDEQPDAELDEEAGHDEGVDDEGVDDETGDDGGTDEE